jgi:DNA-binding response OmpR family regulator
MPPDNQSQRILIVEDEDNARKGYEANLRKLNFEVLGVASGEEALAKFPEFAPNVILVDVELPGMNGLELLRQLNGEIQHIPAIIITGRGTNERVVEAIEAGA